MSETDETGVEVANGEQLLATWTSHGHEKFRTCGHVNCAVDLSRTGITSIVYSFESCTCPVVEYTHLVEQLWHRECFAELTASIIQVDTATLPADAAVEYLRTVAGGPRDGLLDTSPAALVNQARVRNARSRAADKDEREDRIASAERVLRLAGRLS